MQLLSPSAQLDDNWYVYMPHSVVGTLQKLIVLTAGWLPWLQTS